MNIENEYKVKWIIDGYFITENLKIFKSNNKELKQCLVNYTIGYYLHSKFRSLKYIKENCKLHLESNLPF